MSDKVYKPSDRPKPNVILYECDRQKCTDCSWPICQHTSDITHAKNFKLVDCCGELYCMEEPR